MRSLLSFVFFLGFLSHTFGFEKPQSCKDYYDPIYILNEDLSDTAFVYREPGFSEPNMARFNIRVNDLKKYQFAAEDAHLIATESILNRRWLSQGIKRLMDSALTYSGLLSGEYRSKIKTDAKACLDGQVPSLVGHLENFEKEQINSNDGKLELFILDSLSSAYLAETLLNYINEKEELQRDDLNTIQACLTNARGYGPFAPKYIEQCENEHGNRDHTVTEFVNTTQNQSEVLNKLVARKHLLFELRNDFRILNWYNSKVYLSPFAEILTSQIPGQFKSDLKEAISGEKAPHQIMLSFNRVRRQYWEQFLELGEKVKSDSTIRQSMRAQLNQYLGDVYQSVNFHCENNGSFLHYHSQLLDSMAAQMRTGIYAFKDEADNKKAFIASQGHQCRRWRQQPFEESNRWTTKKVFGMGLLCLGMVSAIVPGIGWVATPALIGTGTGLLMLQNWQDSVVAENNLRNYEFAYLNSWQDFRGIIKEEDRLSDIRAEYIIEGVFAAVGGVTQKYRLTERIFRNSRHLENMRARANGTPLQRARNMDDLINIRYVNNRADVDKAEGAVTRFVRWINRNNEVPAHLRKVQKDGSDYYTLIQTVSSKGGSAKLRDDAFDDLNGIINQYENHRTSIRTLISEGENSRTFLARLDNYMEQLTPNHFRSNNPAELPTFNNSTMKLERGEGGSVRMHFEGIVYNGEDFADEGSTLVKEFNDWDELMAQRARWQDTYDKTFTQNAFEEFSGISRISDEIHAQALRYMILRTIRRNLSLVSDGVRTSDRGTEYIGLTDRQAYYMEYINLILNRANLDDASDLARRNDVFPRGDAFDNLMSESARAEYWDLAFGAMRRRLGQSKYANEISSGALLLAKSVGLRIALLGGTTVAISNIGLDGWVEQNRTAYYAYHGFKESIRETVRWFNKLKDQSGVPYGYTSGERDCAQESRSWTVDNVCLFEELRKELWRESFETRFNPDFDIFKDAELDRKMRRYLRRFLALREHFGDGALYDKFTNILPDVGDDYVRAESEEFIVQNLSNLKDSGRAIAYLLSQILQEPEKIERLELIKERLATMDSPQSVLTAFEELTVIMETGFPNATQSPGTSPQIEAFINYLVDSAKRDAEQNQ